VPLASSDGARSLLMEPLTGQSLPAVPHVVFGIFNLAIPNIIAWTVLAVVFVVSAWLRLPSFGAHGPGDREDQTP
jgi:hypothetical protein